MRKSIIAGAVVFAGLGITVPASATTSQQISYLGHGTITCWEYLNDGWHVNLAPVSTTVNVTVTCQTWDWMVLPKSSGEEIMKITAPDGATRSFNIFYR